MTVSETGVVWRRSSHTKEGNCVEIADLGACALSLRDSKQPDGPQLGLTREGFRVLIERIKAGELAPEDPNHWPRR